VFCYIQCYYEVMFVLHLLCTRIPYRYVSVSYLCIVSFIFVCLNVPAMQLTPAAVGLARKNK
jgi:hypothetical protein